MRQRITTKLSFPGNWLAGFILALLPIVLSVRADAQSYPNTGAPAIQRTVPRYPTTGAVPLKAQSRSNTTTPKNAVAHVNVDVGEEIPVIRIASPIQIHLPEPTLPDGTELLPGVRSAPITSNPAPKLQLRLTPNPTNTPAPNIESVKPLDSAAPLFPPPNSDPEDMLMPLDQGEAPTPLFSLPTNTPTTRSAPAPAIHLNTSNAPITPSSPNQPNPISDMAYAVAKIKRAADPGESKTEEPTATSSPLPEGATDIVYDDMGYEGYGFDGGCGDGHDRHAHFDKNAFCPDPNYDHIPYNSVAELGIYEGKWNMCSQRPLIELGRGRYRNGVVPKSYTFLGKMNPITPGFTLFGDFRTAVAANDNGSGDPRFVFANRLNLDFDLRLTATERIHAFWGPLDEDGRFTRAESSTDGRDDLQFFEELDDDFDTLFFEGDLGYIWGGMTDQWAPFDLPFVVGKFPLLFQNGVWINDAVEGFAFTIPAKNSRVLNWSNFDLTMFFLFDDIDSGAFAGDDNAADAYGFNLFVEAYGGYTEAGYAFLDDRAGLGRSYHNMTIGHTRRFRHRLSNSVRFIVNSGQDPIDGVKTADGQLILIENSLVSSNPTYFVPYFNVFAGFGTPQNLAGQPLLNNVGINFETDGLTGYPNLDPFGQDVWGGAFGFNLLGPRFSWQWILEAAMLQEFSDDLNGDQYAVGTRIQKSINYAWLVRFDAMYGLRENESDISGVRAELRWKF